MLLIDEDTCVWMRVSPCDKRAIKLFKEHYSYKPRIESPLKKGNNGRFVGPGEEITLLSKCGKALFVWRKEKYRRDNQTGINCMIFRNTNPKELLSSELILQAEEIAWSRWPGERLFTFVDSTKIESPNPGYCYKMAGWKSCGKSKINKHFILEKVAA